MENQYYKPYLIETLTEDGIVVTDGPDDEYVKTVPNEDKVVKLLREAIALWESGDRNGFIALYVDEERRKDFTVEERFMFKCTRFGEPPTCLSWINEEIEIEEYRVSETAENENK